MSGYPEFRGYLEGINFASSPPRPLVARAVNFVMMDRAQRDREFITHF